ncbi:MAG: TonB-dependent receptor [Dysgonamonadaceae bacterium]|jgi:hypothetical protein|nr:TonB-dependent receptor [Dysgonamonadaceae bacterium]
MSRTITIILFLALCLSTAAQNNPSDVVIGGQIKDAHSGEVIPFVNIQIKGPETYNVESDDNGEFKIAAKPGDYKLSCSRTGYRKVVLNASANQWNNIKMIPDNQLAEVVVTATQSRSIESASRIDREAMSHLQPTSFTDLLELIPGNISQDPKMGAANTIQLRETGNIAASGSKTNSPNYAISSLGTLFLIDGAPINTDANLQEIPNNVSTADDSRSTVNRGVDMRSISTDNIESVEIVRGIPSAEYGNLTSGLVNIKTIRKAGKITARFKADGYSKLFAVGKGLKINENLIANLDGGFLNAKIDPRNNYENYKRVNASIRLTYNKQNNNVAFKWTPNIDYTASLDDVKDDADLNYGGINEYKSSYNSLKLTNNMRWTALKTSPLKAVDINSAITTQFDRLEQRKLVAPTRYGLAPTTETAGEHDAQLIFSEYIADYLCDGKPVNAFFKIKGHLVFTPANIKNEIKFGVEYNYTKNFGKGQVYDASRPITATGWHHRPRAYKDIPALQNLSLFAEDYITAKINEHKTELQIGLRSVSLPGIGQQYVIGREIYLDPRINVRWNFPTITVGKNKWKLALSAGGGKTTRMPTINYLYPNPAYTDIIQLGYYDTKNPTQHSRFNIKTYIHDPTNYQLQPARNTKQEIRIEADCGENRLSVACFTEDMTSGFRFANSYQAYTYKDYDESAVDGSSLQAPPNLETIPYVQKKKLSGYSSAENGSRLKKEGVEFQFNLQRIKPLRTAITINGAYFRSTYTNSRPMFETVSMVVGDKIIADNYIGLYDQDDGRVNRQFNTNFMFDTQVPEMGLIFSAALQCMWYIRTQSIYKNGIPIAYLDVEDGQLHPYTEDSKKDQYLQHLIKNYNDDVFLLNEIPVACYVNLKVTKKIDRFLELALFVNRLFDYTPDYTTNGFTRRRNVDCYFGMELNFKL